MQQTIKKIGFFIFLFFNTILSAQETYPHCIVKDFAILDSTDNKFIQDLEALQIANSWYAPLDSPQVIHLDKIIVKLKTQVDRESQVALGICLLFKGGDFAQPQNNRYKESIGVLDTAILIMKQVAQDTNEVYATGMAYSFRAYSHSKIYNVDEALLNNDLAINVFNRIGFGNLVFTEMLNKTNTYLARGEDKMATKLVNEMQALPFDTSAFVLRKTTIVLDLIRAKLLEMQGSREVKIGEIKAGVETFHKGLSISKKSFDVLNSIKKDLKQEFIPIYFSYLLQICDLYKHLPDIPSADSLLYYSQKSKGFFLSPSIQEAIAYQHKQQLSLALNKIQIVLKFLNPSEKNSIDVFDTPSLKVYHTKGLIAQGLFDSTKQKGKPDMRYLYLNYACQMKAIEALDSLRFLFLVEDTQQLISNNYGIIYKYCAVAAALLYKETHNSAYLDSILIQIEHQKSYKLRNAIYRKSYKNIYGTNNPFSTLFTQEQELRKTLIFAQNNWAQIGSNLNLKALHQAHRTYQYFKDSLKNGDSLARQYYTTRFTDSVPTIQDVQNHWLKTDNINKTSKAYLTFSFMPRQTLALLITQDTAIPFLKLNSDAFLEDLKKLRQALETEQSKDISASAYAVYKVLMQDIVEKLPPSTHLIISADGPLARIPFEILLTEPIEKPNNQYATMPFLLRKHRISYILSLPSQVWLNEFGKNKESAEPRMGIFKGNHYKADVNLGELPDLADVSDGILKAYNNKGEVFQYTSADYGSSENAKQDFIDKLNDINAFYCAAHGMADKDNPLDYALIFRSPKDSVKNRLTVAEIYDLTANQLDLVVLGACKTQAGFLDIGEGLMSIARAFQFIGCRHIVSTLNDVKPKPTSIILKLFFDNYRLKKMPISEALHAAKLSYLNDKALNRGNTHPYFWANIIYIGDN
jgi:CHAT domain-containing protein